jgi:dynactin complex subunit
VERNGEVLYNQTGSDLQFSKGYGIGNINISFSASGQRQVSFDFYHDEDPLVNIIDKRDIRILEEALGKVHGSLMNVSRNQQFHIERDETHKDTLQVAESHIKWTGVVKIVFLLASALLQLWIMKGFFANTHPYEPVATS